MSLLTEQDPPQEGTKAAVRYWAARTREALRFATTMMDEGDWESASTWATDASGCAGEFDNAILAAAPE